MDMEMPKPGPEHENLAKLAGQWVGEETMFPSPWSPEKQTTRGQLQSRVLEDFFVVSDYEQSKDGQVTFRGHGVYSYDPHKKKYVMYWFDSMGGGGGVAEGEWNGNKVVFENTSPMGHHRYSYTFEENLTVFEMSISNDGENWQTTMEGRYQPA